jgi:4-hydroxy-tetrahydrodipicolinate synthase
MVCIDEARAKMKGLFNITLTPFGDDGAIDKPALAENIERVVDLGFNGVLVSGTYGEFYAMDAGERAALFRHTMDVVNGRVPVMLCTAAGDIRQVRELTVLASEVGGVPMLLPPLTADVNEAQILAFFEETASLSKTGVVIYNAPRVAVTLAPSLLERLADIPGVVAVKQGDLSPNAVDDLANRIGGRINLFCASDLAFLGPVMAGFNGLSSTNSCAFPEIILHAFRALEVDQAKLAQSLHAAWHPFRVLARRYGQPQTTKAAMNARGFKGGRVRPPLTDLDAPACEEVARVVELVLAACCMETDEVEP